MTLFDLHLPVNSWLVVAFLAGVVAGTVSARLISHISPSLGSEPANHCETCAHWHRIFGWIPVVSWFVVRQHCPACGKLRDKTQIFCELATGILFVAFLTAYFASGCQQIPEVQPHTFWRDIRAIYQLVLIFALIVATGTDLRDYVIPVDVTYAATAFAVVAATASGQLQMIHLWVDWNVPQVDLYGQYVPAWIDQHRHLHGLVYSLAGILAGGGITWAARVISRLVLGQEALGFGDVLLMGMIGAFIGWQPVTIVFLLAPFCGMLFVAPLIFLTGRPYVPYGPFLAVSAIVVVSTWKWLWMAEPLPGVALRYIFGDAWALVAIAAVSLVAFVATLGLVRLYRFIPGKQRPEPGDGSVV